MKEDKLNFLLEAEPQLYSSKPNKYIIHSEKLGLYSKKDAQTICNFIKYSGLKNYIINRLKE